jgi:CheY-like chemotaxis protein
LTSIGAQTGLEFSNSGDILKVTGADAFLDKPVSPKVFIEEIEKLAAARKKA